MLRANITVTIEAGLTLALADSSVLSVRINNDNIKYNTYPTVSQMFRRLCPCLMFDFWTV